MAKKPAASVDVLDWLLEPNDPAVRHLALRDLADAASSDKSLAAAGKAAHKEGPIPAILAKMHPDGYWSEPGPGYYPKYRSTIWSIILLAQLGASIRMDKRIQKACDYLMDHACAEGGQISANGAPSGTADCMQGNIAWALPELGYADDRLEKVFDWTARSVTGEGIAPITQRDAAVRYYAGKCGPDFACGSNNKLPCAWGGAKVMLALGRVPEKARTPAITRAIKRGVEFFFSVDPAGAAYPSGWAAKPSGNWWKFGFPVFYVTDLLQVVEALCALGYGADKRLARAAELIRGKQDAQGRWALEYDYAGKTWVDFGKKKMPNKYVTLRALRVLQSLRV